MLAFWILLKIREPWPSYSINWWSQVPQTINERTVFNQSKPFQYVTRISSNMALITITLTSELLVLPSISTSRNLSSLLSSTEARMWLHPHCYRQPSWSGIFYPDVIDFWNTIMTWLPDLVSKKIQAEDGKSLKKPDTKVQRQRILWELLDQLCHGTHPYP